MLSCVVMECGVVVEEVFCNGENRMWGANSESLYRILGCGVQTVNLDSILISRIWFEFGQGSGTWIRSSGSGLDADFDVRLDVGVDV